MSPAQICLPSDSDLQAAADGFRGRELPIHYTSPEELEIHPDLTQEERVRRLKIMLSQVAGPGGLESLSVSTPAAGYESLSESPETARDTLMTAVRKLRSGGSLSPDEAFGLEAIVLPDKRPVVFIRNNVFDPLPMDDWVHLNKPDVHARLEPLFTSIGRVELPTTPSIPYGGTGFLVGPDLLITNRHVARLFTDGLGSRLRYHSGGSAVDFKREDGTPLSDTSARVEVAGVVMIHPYWDVALLKVVGLPASAQPLPLSVLAPEAILGRDVVVVGYPARDYRNPFDIQDRIFELKYGVKRMQPGKVQRRDRIQSFENDVDAMTHDSSTLGGNSGSAVIDVATGTIVGLHFAGEYLKANYGVPTYELARDNRVVAAGLNFQGSVAPTTAWASSWVRVDAGPEDIPKPDHLIPPPPTPSPSLTTLAAGAMVSFTIPLNVTISVGTPVMVGAASPTDPAAADASVEKVPVIYPSIESRVGYRNDFLDLADGKTVPMPQLTSAGKATAAKLDDGTQVLHYHKFSLVMHKKRRLSLFTAANVDWRPQKRKIDGRKPSRKELDGFTGNEREDWVIDSRIPFDHQLPDHFYTRDGGSFDKGHLVRRDDVAWGDSFEDMQKGNGDTFHTTNCSPQTAEFNRGGSRDFNWGALEDMVQQETKAEKVCVFFGPVLDDGDRFFHGLVKSRAEVSIQIPKSFWKIIVANNDGEPAAFGFVLHQALLGVDLHDELAVPNAWKNYSSRSPVLCILDQGYSIARHEIQGTEVLPELSAPAGEVGRPRGAVEGARGHCRSSPGATRCGEEGFLDLVQATVFGHRQAAQTSTAGGPAAAPHRRATRSPQARTRRLPA